MAYEQPPIITAAGGIDLNGREGSVITFGLQDADGVAVDISTWILYFEVDGLIRSALTPGLDDLSQVITITQDDTDAIYGAGARDCSAKPFVVRREDSTVPRVLWEGRISVHGYIAEPT